MTHHCTVILHIAGSHGAVTVVFSLAFPSCLRRWGVLGRHWCSINGSVAVVYTDSISGSTCPSGSREYCCRGSYQILPIRSVIRRWRQWSWRPFHPTRVDRQIKRHAGDVSTWSTYNEFHYGNITELRSCSNGTALRGIYIYENCPFDSLVWGSLRLTPITKFHVLVLVIHSPATNKTMQ